MSDQPSVLSSAGNVLSKASARTASSGVDGERLLSLDTYRGLIMVALAFNGFGLAKTADNLLQSHPDSSLLELIRYEFSHVDWVGCAFWDMIQPSFMFMVGVSMAYSYVKRQARGDAWGGLFRHALSRSLILILLGVFLSSTGSDSVTTNWVFMNVLSQIGLGYPFLFLMWRRTQFQQWLAVAGLLAITWTAYQFYPQSGMDPQVGDPSVGVEKNWSEKHLKDVEPAWHKNANIGHAVDLQVLNWFPRTKPFEFNGGGYQTINFIPSLATMLIGLICGEILRSAWTGRQKVLHMMVMGIALVMLGLVLQSFGIALVKRIWTPSWALFSTGICCMILASLYGIIDVAGIRSWSKFLVIVGMNSIAIYMMGQLLRSWTAGRLRVHLFRPLYDVLEARIGTGWLEDLSAFAPMWNDITVGLVFWLVCYWMYRNRIFIRV